MKVATLNMVRLDRRQRTSLQSQLYRQVKELIITGRLKAGVRVPSTRDLVGQLGVSRNTIIYALDQLAAEGYLNSRIGSGIYVADLPTREVRIAAVVGSMTERKSPQISVRAARFSISKVTPEYATGKVRPFRPCQPALDHFPMRNWNRARSYALRSQTRELLWENDAAGVPRLRTALSAYLKESRGVVCTADQIIVTAGTQQALSLLAECLIDRGDPVWIEDPGYLGAKAALAGAGARLVPIPVDADGLTIPPVGPTKLPRAIYTTPSRQFPLGVTMSLARRLDLLKFARECGAWVIEDDYDSEFRYTGRPLPCLQGLASDDNVIYTGSFSKVLFPSLRLGYVVVPNKLGQVMRKAKEMRDGSAAALDQATAAVFLEQGFFSTHVRRMRKLYRERLDIFLEEARRNISGRITFPQIEAGMDAVGWLPPHTDDERLSQQLAAAGVDVPPLSAYSLVSTLPGLVFGFTAFSRTQIRSSMQTMGKLINRGGRQIFAAK
jgi:GntR family transcriptional regulator/MocR family aminotransferase